MQAFRLQRAQHRKLHHVHPDRLGVQAVIAQDTGQPPGVAALDPHLLRNGAAPTGNPGPPVLPVVPLREHLVGSGRRPDIPQNRLLPPHHQAAPEQLIPGPVSDMGSGDIPDVVHIEQNQGSYFRTSQRVADFSRTVGPQPGKIDALLPVGPQRCPGGRDRHGLRRGVVILNHVGSFQGYTGAYSPASAGRGGTRGAGTRRSSADHAVSTMRWVDSPYLVNRYGASRAPSAKVSARPTRRRGRPRPASARLSATAEPKPPMTEWFSAVTTASADVATDTTVAVSNGLMTGILTTTVTAPPARRTRAAASAGAIIMPLTSNATSQDATEVQVSPRIPAPPRLTPPPALTPPPSVSARPAICAPPRVTAPPALCPPPSVTAAPVICAPPRVTPPPEVCAPPEVAPPPSVPAPPVVGAPPPISSPRHSSTWARSSDKR